MKLQLPKYIKENRIDKWLEDFMKWVASFTSDPSDYVSVHGFTYLVFGILGIPYVAYLACKADYEVLYGIFMQSSHNAEYASTEALMIALVVCALILFTAGKITFMLTNKLYKEKGHVSQLVVYLLLFSFGFGGTLYLSFQTDQKEKANGKHVYAQMRENKAKEENDYYKKQNSEEKRILQQFRSDSVTAAQTYDIAVQAAINPNDVKNIKDYKRKRITWEGRLNNKNFTKAGVKANIVECDKKIAYYTAKVEKQKQAAQIQLTEALALANNIKQQKLNAIFDRYSNKNKSVDTLFQAGITDLTYSVTLAANATKGRNVALNFLAVLLTIGFVKFKKQALESTQKSNGSRKRKPNIHTGHGGSQKNQKNGSPSGSRIGSPSKGLYKKHKKLIKWTRLNWSKSLDENNSPIVRSNSAARAVEGISKLENLGFNVYSNSSTGELTIQQP